MITLYNLTLLPDECMAYTSVFQTVRIEMFISLAVGLAIGLLAGRSK